MARETRWTSVGRRSLAIPMLAGYMGPYTKPTTAAETAFSINEGTNQMRRCMQAAMTECIKSTTARDESKTKEAHG